MAQCPGCGARIWVSDETYGHILGCGARHDGQDGAGEALSPYSKEVQRRIIAEALDRVSELAEDQDRADALAKALGERLSYYNTLSPEEQHRYGVREEEEPGIAPEDLAKEFEELRRRLRRLEKVVEGLE